MTAPLTSPRRSIPVDPEVPTVDLVQFERRQALLAAEVQHRVQNTLSVIQSLAQMSFVGIPREVVAPFEQRLLALAEVHSLLVQSAWEGAGLRDVLERASKAFHIRERMDISGPAVGVNPTAAVLYGLAFHELCANAVKHGSLSNAEGRLDVSWTVVEPHRGKFHLNWREHGGPPVTPPIREGFGSRLLNRDLLAIIATEQPESVADLAQKAGRAQPNVSRSLASLVRAGLLELSNAGRTTRPMLTAFGADKVQTLDLTPPADIGSAGELVAEAPSEGIFLVDIKTDQADADVTLGSLKVVLRCLDGVERRGFAADKDLDQISVRLLNDWWRVFHRRDAPYKVAELYLQKENIQRPAALYIKSWGRNADVCMREGVAEPNALAPSARLPATYLQTMVLDGICRPVARSLRRRSRHDRPIHSLLARLESTLEQPLEAAFSRTAGALGLSPYALDEQAASQVRQLIDRLPREDARLDFASAVLDKLAESEAWMDSEEQSKADSNGLPALVDLSRTCSSKDEIGLRPWKRGVECAKRMRKVLSLGTDDALGGVHGLVERLNGSPKFAISPKAPGALRGIQSTKGGAPLVMVAGEDPASTAFVLARAVGDYVIFGDERSCVADLYTDRQAAGRAFAAELLAPAQAVVAMVEDEDLSYHEIAEHFGAPVVMIERQYQNNAGQHA